MVSSHDSLSSPKLHLSSYASLSREACFHHSRGHSPDPCHDLSHRYIHYLCLGLFRNLDCKYQSVNPMRVSDLAVMFPKAVASNAEERPEVLDNHMLAPFQIDGGCCDQLHASPALRIACQPGIYHHARWTNNPYPPFLSAP